MSTGHEDREAWDAIASYWDQRMGEGNDFVHVLIWPTMRRLLPLLRGLRVLDIGCGNGLYSRKLASEGAQVHAIDYSAKMIEHARAASGEQMIEYEVLDASDPAHLDRLPSGGFDAALCTMVLMDMANIEPLLRSLPRILTPGSSFVFATAHPCFNSPHAHLDERGRSDKVGKPTVVRVEAYRTPNRLWDMAMRGQPAKTAFLS